jgi:histone arginine demethylase JMJD6
MNTTASLSATATIERRTDLPPGEFRRRYLHPHRPVVISDGLKAWPALARWSPQFFKDRYAAKQVTAGGNTYPLGKLMDWVMRSTADDPAPYLRNEQLEELFPELMPDIQPTPEYLKPNWLNRPLTHPDVAQLHHGARIELFIGGAGQSFPVLHYDELCTHAFLMQIYGRKQYFVYPPDQTPFMYPIPDDPNRSQLNDVESPDLERFPLFARARGLTFTLDAGEMLFVPGGWWHTVRMLTPSITLSVNSANSSNWRLLSRDVCRQVYRIHPSRKKRLKLAAYLGCHRLLNTLKDWTGSPS